jgi:hypothetical protein
MFLIIRICVSAPTTLKSAHEPGKEKNYIAIYEFNCN